MNLGSKSEIILPFQLPLFLTSKKYLKLVCRKTYGTGDAYVVLIKPCTLTHFSVLSKNITLFSESSY